jgi:hypothetical protein
MGMIARLSPCGKQGFGVYFRPMKKPTEEESRGEGSDGQPSAPTPEAYYAHTGGGRNELTPRDIARNQGVDRLFDAITPGLPIDVDPGETHADPQRISDTVEALVKKLRLSASPWIDELTAAWPKLVPPEVSKFAYPGKWDDGILYIYVSNSVHLFEIRRVYQRKIEAAIRGFADGQMEVRQVRLMVNEVPFLDGR